jgi:hypothetical protein
MSLQEKLKNAKFNGDEKVVLSYSDGGDVVHAWDGFEEEVIEQTSFANTIAELVTDPSFKNNPIIEEMRVNDLLDDYSRDGTGFAEYVADVISDHHYDYEWIECETERYDYKRGYLTLSTAIETTVADVLKIDPYLLNSWSISVRTPSGRLIVE